MAVADEIAQFVDFVDGKKIVVCRGVERQTVVFRAIERARLSIVECHENVISSYAVLAFGCKEESHAVGHEERIVGGAIVGSKLREFAWFAPLVAQTIDGVEARGERVAIGIVASIAELILENGKRNLRGSVEELFVTADGSSLGCQWNLTKERCLVDYNAIYKQNLCRSWQHCFEKFLCGCFFNYDWLSRRSCLANCFTLLCHDGHGD